MHFAKLIPPMLAVSLLVLFPAPSVHSEPTLAYSTPKPIETLKVNHMAPYKALEFAPFPFKPMGTYPNPFPKGQCTYGAASMKGNITWRGNASEWADKARALGKTVSNVPIVGAVAQHGGGAGHVGVVTGVRPGQILLAEMNYDWHGGVRTTWQPTSRYAYIYI